jgi:hypothetical protein
VSVYAPFSFNGKKQLFPGSVLKRIAWCLRLGAPNGRLRLSRAADFNCEGQCQSATLCTNNYQIGAYAETSDLKAGSANNCDDWNDRDSLFELTLGSRELEAAL